MAAKSKSPRLGRGLSALMAQPVKVSPQDVEVPESKTNTEVKSGTKPETKPEAKIEARTEVKTASVQSGETPASQLTSQPVSQQSSKSVSQPANKPVIKASSDSENADSNGKTAQKSQNSEEKAQNTAEPDLAAEKNDEEQAGGITWLSPSDIVPNPHQPRRAFDEPALARLAASIKEAGLMQPIIVRPAKKSANKSGKSNGKYGGHTHELVAGERRWRAVQMAGLQTIPAIVRDLDDNQSAEWALVENLQREDLNPMERAEAFGNLTTQFGLSHEQIAQRVGVERSTISNLLRFIDLEPQVKDWIRQGRLSAGQARALAGVTDKASQKALAQKVIAQEMSVRATEAAVRQFNQDQDEQANEEGKPLKQQARAAHLADLEQQISQQLETKVRIRPGRKKGSGTMSIDFYSVDQFDTLLKRLAVDAE